MAEPFVRVDLAPSSRDFQPVALGPGLPMLDRNNATYQVLRGWLRDYVAEPVPGQAEAAFLIPPRWREGTAPGAAAERPIVSWSAPVTPKDLKGGPLRKELETLRKLVQEVKPANQTQAALLGVLNDALTNALSPSNPYPGCHLFKYRTQDGTWRLVWCWGYRRKDQAPVEPFLREGRLMLRREGDPPLPKVKEIGPRRSRALPMLATLVLLLLVGAGVGWRMGLLDRLGVMTKLGQLGLIPTQTGPPMSVTPETSDLPAGGRVAFAVTRRGADRKPIDVGAQAVAVVEDPRILEIDPATLVATAKAPGSTVVSFYHGGMGVHATVKVRPPEDPTSLTLEPEKLDLAIGSTAQLKLIGKYKDNSTADLTGRAEWTSLTEGTTFCYRGLLEGLAEGAGKVRARYRSSPEGKPLEATLNFQVAEGDFKDLTIDVEPKPLIAGKPAALKAEAVGANGAARSVLQSSKLKWEPDTPGLSIVDGTHVQASQPGPATLKATFGELSKSIEFEVVADSAAPATQDLIVAPKAPALGVGEVVRLELSPASDEEIEVTSKAPKVVEVGEDGRLIGRSAGEADIEVKRGDKTATVKATVAEVPITSIAILPDPAQVAVEATVPLRVVGRGEGGRELELDSGDLAWEVLPSSQFVEFDPEALSLRGIAPTASTPQTIGVRRGELRAKAKVEVAAAPFTLEVTPAGPISLPVGQTVKLQAWASYGDGRRVEITGDGLEWKGRDVSGLSLKDGLLEAGAPDAGPLNVRAAYRDQTSNEVVVRSTSAAPVTLALKAARDVLLVGESGKLALAGGDDNGSTDLAAQGATFESAAPMVVKVDPKTGAYRALAPGEAKLTAKHPAGKEPATLDLRVVDPKQARLVYQPGEVRVAVNTEAKLELNLATKAGDKEELTPLGSPPGLKVDYGRTDTIYYSAPKVRGRVPCEPFPITASYRGLSATAKVQVVASKAPNGKSSPIRIDPSEATLAVGEVVAPKVEQQLPGTDTWQEVQPDAVRWQVPTTGVVWKPPTSFKPTVGLAKGSETQVLTAEYQGQKATLTLTPATGEAAAKKAAAPTGPLSIRQEPTSDRRLFVGHERRFTVVAGDTPVPGVRWTPDFEDAHVLWKDGVLTAKRGGKTQQLTAQVGGKTLTASVITMEEPSRVVSSAPSSSTRSRSSGSRGGSVRRPARGGRVGGVYRYGPGGRVGYWGGPNYVWPGWAPTWWGYYGFDPRVPIVVDGRPMRVEDLTPEQRERIIRDRANPPPAARPTSLTVDTSSGESAATIPVGASFADVRVLAHYEGIDEPRDVSRIAVLRVGPEPIAAIRNRQVVGLRPGRGFVEAQFGGFTSDPDLTIEVTGEARLDRIELRPARSSLAVGDTATLRAIGYLGGRAVGDVTDWGALAWKSRDPSIVGAGGPTVVGLAPGQGGVTAQLGTVVSNVALVDVVASARQLAGEGLSVPEGLDMLVGETRHLGSDVPIRRGDLDVSDWARVSASPGVLRYDPRARSLTAVAPGTTDLTIAVGGSAATVPVRVRLAPTLDPAATRAFIEPRGDVLGVGESRNLRVYLAGGSGESLDCTGSALLSVTGPALRLAGTTVVGQAVGSSEVVARVPGVNEPARATFTVRDEALTGLSVAPNPARLAVGERVMLQVTGVGPNRRIDLGAHADLALTIDAPDIAEVVEGDVLVGLAPGRTSLRVAWRGQHAQVVPVEVSGDAPTGLRIAPTEAEVEVGQEVAFQVLGDRDGRLSPLGPDDDVELRVGDTGVAEAGPGLTVRGASPGLTEVVARLGTRRASANLRVVAASADPAWLAPPDEPPSRPVGLRFAPESITLTLGTAGQPVDVLQVLDDGETIDVSATAALTAADNKIVSVQRTSSGPLLKPLAVGQTQVTAAQGTSKSTRPLLVQVVDADRAQARLQVAPNPLIVRVGESAAFDRVEVVPAPGQPPVEVAAQVESADSELVGVEGGRALRGKKAGRGLVTVKAVAPGGKYDGLTGTAAVEVVTDDEPAGEAATLALSGPGRATVGQRVNFRVDRMVDGVARPATDQATSLVLGQDQAGLAEVRPGGILIARKPGKVTVQARQGALVSNSVELTIEAVAAAFQRVEVVIRPEPLVVGERRPYRVIGHPEGEGGPQDLTGLVAEQLGGPSAPKVELVGDAKVVAHEPPFVVAKGEGSFRLKASVGGVQGEEVELQVLPLETLQLRIEPASATIRLGESTPTFRVAGRTLGGETNRDVSPTFSSTDPSVLAPDPKAPGQFVGKGLGSAQVKATFDKQDVFAQVSVVGSRFASVKDLDRPAEGNTFAVEVEVRAPKPPGGVLEYRISKQGEEPSGAWTKSESGGDGVRAVLRSPKLEFRPESLYRLVIESRDPADGTVEVYPYTFRVGVSIRPEQGQAGP